MPWAVVCTRAGAELIHPPARDDNNTPDAKQKRRSGTPSKWMFGRGRKGQKGSKNTSSAMFVLGSNFGSVSPDMYDDDSM